MKTLSIALALVVCAGFASAQGSDTCTTPTVVTGAGPFAFNNSAATMGTEGQTESACLQFGYTAVDKDVWFTWNATFTGFAVLETCTPLTAVGNDTKIGFYPGNTCPVAGTALGCNDDACGLRSKTNAFSVTMGQDYVIQIGVYPDGFTPGFAGNFGITPVTPPPSNDSCSTPIVLAGPGLTSFNNALATTGTQGQTEAACAFFSYTAIQRDLWYTYTATANGSAKVSTCGLISGTSPSSDTKVGIYNGAGCPSGAAIACNDDSGTGAGSDPYCGTGSTLTSNVNFPVTCGNVYTIQLGMYGGTTLAADGQFSLAETGTACSTPFTSYCSGDGSDATCPCTNVGLAGRGCDNTVASGGALVTSTGNASVATPTLVLNSTFAVPFGPGLYYEGNARANASAPFGIPFGNGLRCAGGATNRLEIRFADGVGAANTTVDLQAFGAAVSGTTYHYQLWYRDTGNVGSCTPGAGFNFSNAISLTWAP